MYPRTDYEMSEGQLEKLLNACQPVAVMKIGNYSPSSPQENANRAWQQLGKEMGFEHMTVKPSRARGQRFFTAIPSETSKQRQEREEKEAQVKRAKRIETLRDEIDTRRTELQELG